MPKYAPLAALLNRQRDRELVLTFSEIERVIGSTLPESARRPQWWANTTDPDQSMVQRKAWRSAGYDAFLLTGTSKVKFKRVSTA